MGVLGKVGFSSGLNNKIVERTSIVSENRKWEKRSFGSLGIGVGPGNKYFNTWFLGTTCRSGDGRNDEETKGDFSW